MTFPRFSRRHFLAHTTLIATAPHLFGCGKTSESMTAATSSGSPTPGVLRYVIREEPTTLDPHLCFSDGTWDVLQNTFDGLVIYDADNKLVPVLAEALPQISADGRTYTFRLKKNVRFHDGTMLDANAIRVNALRILSKTLASPRATLTLDDVSGAKEYIAGETNDIPGVQVVDTQTIRFVLTEPRAYFLDKLTTFLIVSPAAIAKAAKNERGVPELSANTAVGTGAFRLSEYRRQAVVVQTAFDGVSGAKPNLSRIERPIVIDAKTTRNLYDSGAVDIYLENVADYEADKANPDTQAELAEWRQAGLFFVTLGQKKNAAMRDVRVRQALSRAIDRAALAENALAGMYPPATGLIAPGLLGGYDPDGSQEVPDTLQYDTGAAKKLLADAGYSDVKPLAFTILYSEGSVTAAKVTQVLKEQWGTVGVSVTLQEQEWGTLLKRMESGDFDAMYSGWSASPDPHSTLHALLASGSPNNYGGYNSAAFDAAVAAGDKATGETERGAAYHKAVEIALKDAPILPVVFVAETRLIRLYITGLRYSLGGMLPHTTTAVR